jgi:hypothetical protein
MPLYRSSAFESPLQSAYKAAVAGGFSGTQTDWVMSFSSGVQVLPASEIVISRNSNGDVENILGTNEAGAKSIDFAYENGEVSEIDINNNDIDKKKITFSKDQDGNIEEVHIEPVL